MSNGMGEGQSVQYTTKELLARIESKVDQVNEKLDLKASIAVTDEMTRRIGQLEVLAERITIPAEAIHRDTEARLRAIERLATPEQLGEAARLKHEFDDLAQRVNHIENNRVSEKKIRAALDEQDKKLESRRRWLTGVVIALASLAVTAVFNLVLNLQQQP